MVLRIRTALSGDSIVGPAVSTMIFSGDTVEDAQAAADAAGAFWNALAATDGLLGANCVANVETIVEEFDTSTGEIQGEFVVTEPTVQQAPSSTPVAAATQALVTWRTSLFVAGRRLQGRSFIPCVKASHVNASGRLTAAGNTVLQEAADDHLINPTAGIHVWSRTHGAISPAQTAVVTGEFSVLRSRRD